MEQMFTNLLAKAPELSALLAVVFLFLRHLSQVITRQLDYDKERDGFIKGMHDDHLRAREETREVMRESIQVTRENTVALQSMRDSIADCPLARNNRQQ